MPVISYTLPAPYLGQNSRDPIDQMQEGYAIRLKNMRPNGTAVELRGGHVQWSTGLSSNVGSLFEFVTSSGTSALVAAANSQIWNCSTQGQAVGISISSLTYDYWQAHNFRNRLILVNGVDQPQQLQLTGSTLSGADATYTGISDDAALIQGCLYRSRQYFVQKNTQSVWYGAVDAITGALVEYSVGGFLHRGGKLLWVNSFSNNTGNVLEDLLVICSEKGELLIYGGDYPGGTWSLQARRFCGKPLGIRSWVHVQGDLLVITEAGVASVAALLNGAEEFYLTDIDYSNWNTKAQYYGSALGWCAINNEKNGYTLINVPVVAPSGSTPAQSEQVIINNRTNAISEYTGLSATAWAMFDQNPYFASSDGKVYRAEYGDDDNGTNITIDIKQAFNAFGSRGNVKHFIDARPYIESSADTQLGIDIDVDFKNKNVSNSTIVEGTTSGTAWGSAWGSAWAVVADTNPQTVKLTGQGNFGALRYAGAAMNTSLKISACQIRFDAGGQK